MSEQNEVKCPACERGEKTITPPHSSVVGALPVHTPSGNICLKGVAAPVQEAAQPTKCAHLNFAAKIDVNRIISEEGGQVIGYHADVRVNCAECGLPFEFVGVVAGLSYERPMCDISAQELRVPLRTKGCKIMPGIPGFEVKAQ